MRKFILKQWLSVSILVGLIVGLWLNEAGAANRYIINVAGSALFIDDTMTSTGVSDWSTYYGYRITATDSAGKTAYGYIGPVGTEEPFGSPVGVSGIAKSLDGSIGFAATPINGGVYRFSNLSEMTSLNGQYRTISHIGTTAWTQVAPLLGSETHILSLTTLNGKIYGGTAPNGNLYEWNGTDAWIQVAPKLEDETQIRSLTTLNGKIYGGTIPNGNLYEWNGTTAWTQVAPKLEDETHILSLTTLNGKIYGGTYPNSNLLEWGSYYSIGDTSAETAQENTGGLCAEPVFTSSFIGCSIYSTPSLATNSWASVDSSFNPNAIVSWRYDYVPTTTFYNEGYYVLYTGTDGSTQSAILIKRGDIVIPQIISTIGSFSDIAISKCQIFMPVDPREQRKHRKGPWELVYDSSVN